MSKRALEESASGSQEPVAGGNISINELLSNSEDPDVQGPGSNKKPRNFIAAVVFICLSIFFFFSQCLGSIANTTRHAKIVV